MRRQGGGSHHSSMASKTEALMGARGDAEGSSRLLDSVEALAEPFEAFPCGLLDALGRHRAFRRSEGKQGGGSPPPP